MVMFRTEAVVGAENCSTFIPPQCFPIEKQGRLFSISDVHGCLSHLEALIKKIELKPEDTVVFLGDYVDRGKDSRGVIDYVISLKDVCNVITLVGNHDLMMLRSLTGDDMEDRNYNAAIWLRNGGMETLNSYGLSIDALYSNDLPHCLLEHLEFIDGLDWWYETDDHIFVHATPRPDKPIYMQEESCLVWRRPSAEDKVNFHVSGKTIVSGHTAQADGCPKWLSEKNLLTDTGCFFTGVLTAVQLSGNSVRYISVNSKELM